MHLLIFLLQRHVTKQNSHVRAAVYVFLSFEGAMEYITVVIDQMKKIVQA